MVIQLDERQGSLAKIKVVGVGGAGGNAVNRMVQSGFTGVEFIAVNTDQLALDNSLADVKVSIGSKLTKGLGAGAKPEVGYAAIEEDRQAVAATLEGADMVFITAGMGGGTGTGAAPVVAEIAREMGILSVGVVTRPFLFEGPIRTRNCLKGLNSLREFVDTIIVIQNQKILSITDKNTSFLEAFSLADDVLTNAVRGISEIILKHGDIQVDFADVRAVMENGGDALMGTGLAEGESRSVSAAKAAIESPLLDDVSISGASGLLVNITGGSDLGIHEINEAMSYIYEAVGEDNAPNIIFGTTVNPEYENRISVTVIATGFDNTPSVDTGVMQNIGHQQPARKQAEAPREQERITNRNPQYSAPQNELQSERAPEPEMHRNPPVRETPDQAQYASVSASANGRYPEESMDNGGAQQPAMQRASYQQDYEEEQSGHYPDENPYLSENVDVRQVNTQEHELQQRPAEPKHEPEKHMQDSQRWNESELGSEDREAAIDWDTPAFLRNHDL